MLGTANKLKNARNISLTGAVSGSGNFDGSGNLNINTTQDNIKVLTVEVTTPAAGNEVINAVGTINYPSGYTRDNCIIISLMAWNHAFTNKTWHTVGATGMSSDIGDYGLKAILEQSNISVRVNKINQQEAARTITIRVALMKI